MIAIDERLRLLEPRTVGYLSIYLVIDPRPPAPRQGAGEMKLLDEALRDGTLTIREVDSSGIVAVLLVHNRGPADVLLCAGDVVRGGKQDRVVTADQVIPPTAEPVQLEVNCVEQSRWHADRGLGFSYAGRAESELSRVVQVHGNQTETWRVVRERLHRRGSETRTGAYTASFSDPRTEAQVQRAWEALRDLQHDCAVGVVAAVGAELQTAEIFDDPSLYRRSRETLFRSLILGSLDAAARGRSGGRPSAKLAAAWVRDARRKSAVVSRSGGHSSYTLRSESASSTGFSLVSGDRTLKQTLFRKQDGDGWVPVDPPRSWFGWAMVSLLVGSGCLFVWWLLAK